MRIISGDNFVERVFHDSLSPRFLQARDDLTNRCLIQDGVNRDPILVAQLRNSRLFQGWKKSKNAVELRTMHVEHETDFAKCVDRALEERSNIAELSFFPFVAQRFLVPNQLSVRFKNESIIRRLAARRDEPVSVISTMASARTGGFTSVAPQLNSTLAVTPCFAR